MRALLVTALVLASAALGLAVAALFFRCDCPEDSQVPQFQPTRPVRIMTVTTARTVTVPTTATVPSPTPPAQAARVGQG